MKKTIYKNLLNKRPLKIATIAFSVSLLLTSCVVYTEGYTETDGVYYDPNKDTLPTGYGVRQDANQVGEYYDYNENVGIIEKNQENRREAEHRFKPKYNNLPQAESDWGTYTGTEVNYYDNSFYNPYWGWGRFGYSPYGWNRWGNPWGWGSGFNLGWNNWSGWNFGYHWGWGNSWYGGFYNPWRFGYGFYDPFWGYPYHGFYSPYYYGYGYYGRGYGNYYPRRASGVDRMSIRTNIPNGNINNRMRTGYGINAINRGVQGIRTNSGSMRTPVYQNNNRNYTPQNNGNYRQQSPSMRTNSYDGGFRNNSNGGGFRSGGGFGGGSIGGGMRSGGGMRTGGR